MEGQTGFLKLSMTKKLDQLARLLTVKSLARKSSPYNLRPTYTSEPGHPTALLRMQNSEIELWVFLLR